MKKYLLIIPALVISACLLMGADIARAQSSAYSAGDLIKTADRSTVYYFGFDGRRHAFPNEPTYFSWYSNFDGIKIVTPSELASIALGSNIVVRPGTHLVKIESDPKVYAVESHGILRPIPSEATARMLYGNNWASKILDVNVTFFPDYIIRGPLASAPSVHPEGTVFRYLGNNTTYIYRDSVATPFLNLAQAEAHRYQERFILTLTRNGENAIDGRLHAALFGVNSSHSFNYPVNGKRITEIHPVLIDVAQTLTEAVQTSIIPTNENAVNNYYTYYNGGSCPSCETCDRGSCDTCDDDDDDDTANEDKDEDNTNDENTNNNDNINDDGGDNNNDHENNTDQNFKPSFQVNDRVRYLGLDPYLPQQASENLAYLKNGTIVDIKPGYYSKYLVIFDSFIDSAHASEKDPSQGFGAWIGEPYLELIGEEKPADGPIPDYFKKPADNPIPNTYKTTNYSSYQKTSIISAVSSYTKKPSSGPAPTYIPADGPVPDFYTPADSPRPNFYTLADSPRPPKQ